MKTVLIDPWGTNNTAEYLNGLISGLSSYTQLVVFTNYYAEQYVSFMKNIDAGFEGEL